MAIVWPAKAPSGVKRYNWEVPLEGGDTVQSFSITPSGATVDASEKRDGEIIAYISAGSAGTTASFALSVITAHGETITETAYLPIVATTGSTATAGDIIDYALRTIVGMGETAETEEINDALEKLQDMLAEWSLSGADIGCTFPLTTSTAIYVPRAWVGAIKENLIVSLASDYGYEVSPARRSRANVGLQVIKTSLMSREPAAYY